jgi:hypothetical protein
MEHVPDTRKRWRFDVIVPAEQRILSLQADNGDDVQQWMDALHSIGCRYKLET